VHCPRDFDVEAFNRIMDYCMVLEPAKLPFPISPSSFRALVAYFKPSRNGTLVKPESWIDEERRGIGKSSWIGENVGFVNTVLTIIDHWILREAIG
jgi:hypothetical protein